MHFHNLLLASALTALSLASPIATTTTTPSCVATPISTPPANKRCGDQGTLTNPSFFSAATNLTFADCTTTCLLNKTCLSLSYDSTSSSCQLYTKALNDQGFTTKHIDAGIEYYAAACFKCSTAAASSTTPTPTSTSSTTATPTSTSYSTCTQTAFTVGSHTYTRYYIGSGYTRSPTANTNTTYPMIPELIGWAPATQPCATTTACSTWAYIQSGVYSSFELHLVQQSGTPVWECWAFKESVDVDVTGGGGGGGFEVRNASVVEAYGFSL